MDRAWIPGLLALAWGALDCTDAGAAPPPAEPFYRRALKTVGPDRELRSGLGPMASFLYSHDQVVEGVGGFSFRSIELRFEGTYRFDLLAYLQQSNQEEALRTALAKLAAGSNAPSTPPQRGPSPTLAESSAWLRETGCKPSDLRSFWVDWWDGRDKVALVVEACQPIAGRSAWTMETVVICIRAPSEWLPWLRQVDGDQAVLASGLNTWIYSLSKREAAAARRTVSGLPKTQRRQWIARHVSKRAPLTAAEMLAEAYPWPAEGPIDVVTQRAAADRLPLLAAAGNVVACGRAAAPFFGRDLIPEVEVAVVHALSRCLTIGSSGEQFAACEQTKSPLVCAKPIFDQAQADHAASEQRWPPPPADQCPQRPSAEPY